MADILELTPFSYIVVLGAAISNFAMGLLEPTIALYLLEIGVSYQGVGQILSARFLVVAIASLPLALFASRIGLVNIIYAAGLSAIVAGFVLYFGFGYQAVYAFYFIAGISQAAISGPGAAILAENEGSKRVAAFALFSTTWMIPPALGAGISSLWFAQLSAESAAAYRSIFVLVFLILTIAGVIFMALLLVLVNRGVKVGEETDRKLPIPTQFKILLAPITLLPILMLSVVQFMGGAGAGATLPFLPPYLRSLDATAGEISLLVMILNLSMGVATQFSAPLSKRFGDMQVYAVTTILSVLTLIGIAYSDNLAAASTFYILRGTFANMNAPILQSRMIGYIENSVRATGSAWTSTARWIGWTISSPISGKFIESYGYDLSFIFTSCIYIVAMIIFIYIVTSYVDIEELKQQQMYPMATIASPYIASEVLEL